MAIAPMRYGIVINGMIILLNSYQLCLFYFLNFKNRKSKIVYRKSNCQSFSFLN